MHSLVLQSTINQIGIISKVYSKLYPRPCLCHLNCLRAYLLLLIEKAQYFQPLKDQKIEQIENKRSKKASEIILRVNKENGFVRVILDII